MVLQVENLAISYDGRPVVSDVSFSVDKGQTLAIVGESGSGKTTVIRSILGCLPPSGTITDGTIILNGKSLREMDETTYRAIRGEDMAMVFQDCGNMMNPIQKVGSQFVDYLRLHGSFTEVEAWQQAVQLCHTVALANGEELLSKYPFQLSGGERQRIGIAMALAFSPSLLLADEPTAALDVTTQWEVVRQIRSLQEERAMAIVMVTHNMGVAAYLADYIMVMQQGKVLEYGVAQDVLQHPKHSYTSELLRVVPTIGGRRYV